MRSIKLLRGVLRDHARNQSAAPTGAQPQRSTLTRPSNLRAHVLHKMRRAHACKTLLSYFHFAFNGSTLRREDYSENRSRVKNVKNRKGHEEDVLVLMSKWKGRDSIVMALEISKSTSDWQQRRNSHFKFLTVSNRIFDRLLLI